ncbi:MAG: hypothetical protein KDD64_16980, partial [Bdellovibrionales bacterium]|nr:hypothetical protein [Bdellovibrionales bacterium]
MLRFVFLLVASLTLLVTGFAQAQERVLSVILDSNSTALGDSVINAVFCAPAIEGDYVAFRTNNKTSGIADGIWAYHIPSKSFTKLVGIGTPVPGGTGTFQNFNTAGSSLGGPVLKDGVVVFGGVDQGTNPNGFAPVGVYSVPVTGGAITKIASFQDAAPGTPTNFFNFGEDSRNFGSISQSNGVVVFEGTFGG